MIKINPGDLSGAIEKELKNYEKEVREELQKSGEETAKDVVKTLKETSPKRSGKYSKGWRLKKEASPGAGTRFIIHNKTDYRLTHLLEFGHALIGGGRTRAIPHIKPAEEKAKALFEKKIRSKL